MNHLTKSILVSILFLLVTTLNAIAEIKLTLGVGTLFMSGQSNLVVDDNKENAKLDSLDSKGSHFSGFVIVPSIGISSDALKEKGIDIKLGISEKDEFAPALRIGFKFSEKQRIEFATFYNPFRKAWKDPFLVGVDRDETNLNSFGLRFSYDNILNSKFSFQHRFIILDVNQDDIGERYRELKRDGTRYETQVGYTFMLPKRMMLKPKLIYNHAVFNGNANSYSGYGAELGLIVPRRAYFLMLSGKYTYQDYKAENPIFDKTRKGHWIDLKAAFKLNNFLKIKGAGLSLFVGHATNESNIHFYDSTITTSGLIIDYTF